MSQSEKPFFTDMDALIGFLGYARHMAKPSFRRRTLARRPIGKLTGTSKQMSKKQAFPNVDAWLTISAEFADYLYVLHFHFLDRLHSQDCPLSRATFPLLGGASSDYMAAYKLVELGYDAPARVVVRSMIEKLETIFVLLDRPELVSEFSSETVAERQFWYKYVRSGRSLKAKVRVLKRLDIFEEDESDQYWKSRYATLDPFKHSNGEAGGISMIVFGSGREEFEPGMVGIKTDYSVDTLRIMSIAVADLAQAFNELSKGDDPFGMASDKLTKPLRDIAAFHSVVFPMWEFIVRHQRDPLLDMPPNDDDDDVEPLVPAVSPTDNA